MTPSEQATVDFVKDGLKKALTDLNVTALDHANATDTMQNWMKNWIQPSAEMQEEWKRPVFDSYAMIHYTPKDGASNPRYGWQAVLQGPLFESRKEFRSLRLAKLWVKQQMKCKCWPTTTDSTPHPVDNERVVNMSITFDYEGFLDKSFLVKNESFR